MRQLVKKLIPRRLFRIIEPYGHWAEAIIMNVVHGFPARNLKVIGVTGTNGKTTTSTMIYTMMNQSGIKTGLISTVGYGVPENWQDNYLHVTSVPAGVLMRRIKELKAQGIKWLVFEVTSHALAQHRAWGIPYNVAVMTNVTHEHLDYHRTFERYRAAKLRLFQQANRNRRGLRVGILNNDDPSAQLFAAAIAHPLSYSLTQGDIVATGLKADASGSDLVAKTQDRSIKLRVNMPGSFNVQNALAAVGVGLALGLDDGAIAKGIAALTQVEGRMNTIDEGQDFDVIVDFAHTPDSFEKILSDLRVLASKRLIVVFGSAGRRDESKRAIQGRIAGQYADVVYVTEEDDRDVDGNQIMKQIAGGAIQSGKREGTDLFLILDRTEAIQAAIDAAGSGDTVVLLGKGHEKTIERADGEIPWNESEVARAAIRKRLARS